MAGRPAALVAVCAAQWCLEINGEPWHGSNARGGASHPRGRAAGPAPHAARSGCCRTARALGFWRGHGVVDLIETDLERGALLLQRLDGSRTLGQAPLVRGDAGPRRTGAAAGDSRQRPLCERTNEIVRAECDDDARRNGSDWSGPSPEQRSTPC
jgi:hypothetical protein